MQQIDLIQNVLAAEQQAQALTRDAKAQSQNIDASIEAEITRLKETYDAEAALYLENLEQSEARKREMRLQELDVRLKEKLQQVEDIYSSQREAWIESIFSRIVGKEEG